MTFIDMQNRIRNSFINQISHLHFYTFVLSLCVVLSVSAQSKKELEKKKQQTQKDIVYTNKLLSETQKNTKASYDQLLLLDKKIQLREDLIGNIQSQQAQLNKEINDNNEIIALLEADLVQIKKEYAEMVRFAYRHRNQNELLMFIFSAESFNQAYKRLKYIQQYSEYRKKQAILIEATQKVLNDRKLKLEQQKNELDELIGQHKQESNVLATEKTGQQTVISNLKSEEQKLKQKLRKYEEEKIRIQNTIAELIRKEAEAAAKAEAERRAKEKRKAEAAAKTKAEAKKAADTKAAAEQAAKDKAAGKKPATTPKPEVVKEEPKPEPKLENYDVLSPEQRLISNRFDENKGLMPWPVQRGIIVYKFGKQPHSVLKDIMEQKNGVGFSTSQGATARSIFDGQVTNVLPLSANNFAVMIKHGEYITVYVNVKNIKVAVGQKVTAKQEIGQVYTNPEDDRTTLELQVWKGTVLQNPIGWIAKQ